MAGRDGLIEPQHVRCRAADRALGGEHDHGDRRAAQGERGNVEARLAERLEGLVVIAEVPREGVGDAEADDRAAGPAAVEEDGVLGLVVLVLAGLGEHLGLVLEVAVDHLPGNERPQEVEAGVVGDA